MANSSGSSSSAPLRVSWAPLCLHGLPADILTSHTEKNPGRRFFCCQVRKVSFPKFLELDYDFRVELDHDLYTELECEYKLQIHYDIRV